MPNLLHADDERAPDHSLIVNGFELEYLEWGSAGKTLIMLPDFGLLGGYAREFEQIAPMLADRLHVFALSPRGSVGTSRSLGAYDTSARVEDLKAFMVARKIDKAVLLGAGSAADDLTLFATRYPQMVDKVVYLGFTDRTAKHPEVMVKQPHQPTWVQCLLWETIGSPEAAKLKPMLELKPADADWAMTKAIFKAAYTYHRDYTGVRAPSLAIVASPEKNAPKVAADHDPDSLEQEEVCKWWRDNAVPLDRAAIEEFRRARKDNKVVELDFASQDLVRWNWSEIVPQVRFFVLGEPLPPPEAPAISFPGN